MLKESTPGFRSLERKLLVPLLVMGALAAVAGSWITCHDIATRLEEQVMRRAQVIVDAVTYAAETVDESRELQRIVNALGAEPGVKIIVVAGGDPPRVLACTRNAWLGERLGTLPDPEANRDLEMAIRTWRSHPARDPACDEFDFTSPLLLSDAALADASLQRGAVKVDLDLGPVRSQVGAAARRSSAWQLGAILVVTLVAYWLLRRSVTRPIAAIRAAMGRRATGDESSRAPVGAADEIGSLAVTLNRMIDAIAEGNARFRQLAENIDDAFWIFDLGETVTCRYLSPAHDKILGRRWTETDFAPEAMLETVHPDDVAAVSEAWQRAEDHGLDVEFRVVHPDGSTRWVRARGFPVRDDAGHAYRLAGVSTDITAQKRSEQELRRYAADLEAARGAQERHVAQLGSLVEELTDARNRAETGARARADLLATVSHEIRTPLNAVIGVSGLLLDTPLTSEQREYAEMIGRSGEALLAVINDILDFSKLEAGKFRVETVEFDLHTAVEEVVDLLAGPTHGKGLELVVAVEPEVPAWVGGDGARLRQVLLNLVGNAVKFTDRGEVVVRAALMEEGDGGVLVRFTVTDTGIGIPPAAQAELFKPFSQAALSTPRTHGGTGLGLAISKQLAELMGGEIGATSVPGQGSTFWFTAHFEKRPAPPRGPASDSESLFRGVRVLVVDDNETCRDLLRQELGRWGMSAEATGDAAGALGLLRAARAAGTPYALAIIDLQMPAVDGLELATVIRGTPDVADLPLVLLTSLGCPSGAPGARAVTNARLLTKPIRRAQMYQTIAAVLEPASEPVWVTAGEPGD